MAAPTFLWRDPGARAAASWSVEVTFADGSPALQRTSAGEPMKLGEIDPRAVGETNELPKLTPEQAAAHTWKPDAGDLGGDQETTRSTAPATVTFAGVDPRPPERAAVARARCACATSKDPVGAPIFYRDVPLMPSAGKNGRDPAARDEQGLADRLAAAQRLGAGQPRAAHRHAHLRQLPLVLARREDARHGPRRPEERQGPLRHRATSSRRPSIRNENVVAWSSFRSKLGNQLRVGFMSQVSPDGRHVVTTIKPKETERDERTAAPGCRCRSSSWCRSTTCRTSRTTASCRSSTRPAASWSWYDRASGELQPLPGRRRSALRAGELHLEPGRQVPGVLPRRGEGPAPAGPADGHVRERPERGRRSSTTSTASRSTRAAAASPSRSAAPRRTA